MAIDDVVTRIEQRIDNASVRAANMMKKQVRKRFVRPIFSQKVSEEEMMLEFDFLKDNPSALAQFFRDQKASPESAVEYLETMERKRGSTPR